MDEEFDSGQLIEQRLVVKRHLDELARLEQRIGLLKGNIPDRADDFFIALKAPCLEALSHGGEPGEDLLHALHAFETRAFADQRGHPLGKRLAGRSGFGVTVLDRCGNGRTVA